MKMDHSACLLLYVRDKLKVGGQWQLETEKTIFITSSAVVLACLI